MVALFSEIISILDGLIPTYFKNDKLFADYIKIAASDISKIRNYSKYPTRFSEKELKEILERFQKIAEAFKINKVTATLEYYVFYHYHLAKESVDKHLLVIEYDEFRKMNSIRLIEINAQRYIEDSLKSNEKEVDKYIIAAWEGSGVIHTASLFLNLAKRNVINGSKDPEIQTTAQIILYVGIAQSPAEFVKGIYSTTSDAGFPSAGVCILRKFDTEQIGMKEIGRIEETDHQKIKQLLTEVYDSEHGKDIEKRNKQQMIDDVIALEVRNKLEEARVEGLYADIGHLRSFAFYEKLSQTVSGYYEFYHFSSSEEYIGRASLYIKKDGTVLLTTKLRSYSGDIKMLDAGNFFRMDIFHGHNRQNHYDLIVMFEYNKSPEQVYMTGHFSGFGDKPEAGAIFLQKSSINETQMPFEDFIRYNNKIFLLEEHKDACIELLKNMKLREHFRSGIPLAFLEKFHKYADEAVK